MNQSKLKMLIKFDQIRVMEEFYNSYFHDQPSQQIHLDLEVSESELIKLAETIYRRSVEQKIKKHQQTRRQVGLKKMGISAILMAVSSTPSQKLKLKYAFMLWKMMAYCPQ